MALSNSDTIVLQQIVDLDGECLDSKRCKICPFRVMCLPEFLNIVPPTQQQRANMALDVIAHHILLDDQVIDKPHHQ